MSTMGSALIFAISGLFGVLIGAFVSKRFQIRLGKMRREFEEQLELSKQLQNRRNKFKEEQLELWEQLRKRRIQSQKEAQEFDVYLPDLPPVLSEPLEAVLLYRDVPGWVTLRRNERLHKIVLITSGVLLLILFALVILTLSVADVRNYIIGIFLDGISLLPLVIIVVLFFPVGMLWKWWKSW